ncbi:MAG: flagellar export chaperone FliS [Treponema sp.]|nr:flagellar export chaperone FliS [Treponema sp.]
MAYKNASSTYKETKIKTASQGQLIIMLYEEAIKQLNMAIEMLESKNENKKIHEKIEQINKAIMKAEEIITELMVSLDFEQGGDIAKNLFALYSWFNRELLEASISQNPERIKTVKNMFSELNDSWKKIVHTVETEDRSATVGLNIAG